MLAVFMAVSPRDHPRYYSEASCMQTRSSPVSPGLGFRPQPVIQQNLILVDRDTKDYKNDAYVRNLDQYLTVSYSKNDNAVNKKFTIPNPGFCTLENQYGFAYGRPCVLVKMNKIFSFEPEPGYQSEDEDVFKSAGCRDNQNAISVYCYGEYPADVDNLGSLNYISENGNDNKCGSLDTKWFPYPGKNDRRDVYQAPYIWVQFNNPQPNILINVICRVFAKNIYFDRKTARGLTRFQIYIKDVAQAKSSN
jgi:hypothetical protein